MKKNIYKKTTFYLAAIIFLTLFFRFAPFSLADDDEEEDDDYYRQSVELKPEIIRPISAVAVSGSSVPEELKDSDYDGIPDLVDKYPGKDDFSFSFSDYNQNGIADDLEKFLN